MSTKRALVLDTEVLFSDPYLRKGSFCQLRAHLERDADATFLVSEVVVVEMLNHQRKKLSQALDKLQSGAADLGELHPNLGKDFSLVDIEAGVIEYRRRFREILGNSFRAEFLEVPRVPHSVILDRAIRRRPPFDENGRGYQDTLLWLSLVELSNSGRFDTIMFVSNNSSDFGQKASPGLNPLLQAEITATNIDYLKTLPDAIQRLFSPLPQNLPVQVDANLHRQLVQSSLDSILKDLQLDIDEDMFDSQKYTINSFGETFDIANAKAEQVQDGNIALTLEVRFWRCSVTKWLWQRDPDVFSDHLADILVRTVMVLKPNACALESVQVTAYQLIELDQGHNFRNIP